MIDDLEIIRLLTGQYPEINKLITSPFRKDNNPGARFKYYNSKLRFYDSGDSLRHGKSAINLYMIEKNLSFEDALSELKALSDKPKSKYKPKVIEYDTYNSNVVIKPKKCPWTD